MCVVYLCGQGSGEDVIKRLPNSLKGLLSLTPSPESDGRVVSCVIDRGVSTEDQFSIGLRAELDSSGVSYSLAPLSAENHVALISVEGMTCTSCVKLIETTLPSNGGVSGVKVSLECGEAFVQFNPQVTTAEVVSTAIYDMGFDTSLKKVYTPQPLSSSTSGSGHILVEVEPPPYTTSPSGEEEVSYTCIDIEGMTCRSCVLNVQTNVSKLEGVQVVNVSLDEKNAKIKYDPKLISPNRLASEIDNLGFEAKVKGGSVRESSKSPELGVLKTCYVGIDGMKCKSCVNLIESTLGDLEGVVSIQVSLALKEGTVEYNDAVVTVGSISKAIDDMGFIITYVTGEYLIFCIT